MIYQPLSLYQLFSVFPGVQPNAYSEIEITGIYIDARLVTKNSVFVAIKGSVHDGHSFIPDAINNGAIALVVEDRSLVPNEFSGFVVQVPSTRHALDIIATQFYATPGLELFCIGVTGTNGKTSVTFLCEHILNFAGITTGVIGTVDHHIKNHVWETNMTTPDAITLQKRLREFCDRGALAVALEVSSHALSQSRLESIPFNTVIFTNLTRDHLDYHSDMAQYFEAKQRLFTSILERSPKHPSFAIVNLDDDYGRRLRVDADALLWTYGKGSGASKNADFIYEIEEMNFTSVKFNLKTPVGESLVTLPMSGAHNVQNATAAIAACLSTGVSLDKCVKALESFPGVPGRLQIIPGFKINVFIDYAHTPDALDNVLRSLLAVRDQIYAQKLNFLDRIIYQYFPNKLKNLFSSKSVKGPPQIITIFGCGGERDRGKRPIMLDAALKYSDMVIVTSDNPRGESPVQIIFEILDKYLVDSSQLSTAIFEKVESVPINQDSGARNIAEHLIEEVRGKILVEVSRAEAIQKAIEIANEGDVVLIAGKGHEEYQIIGKEKKYFSDFNTAKEILFKS